MCFKTPDIPKAPPIPSRSAEDAVARRLGEQRAAENARGRAATIVTSPLGDPGYGSNVNRTKITGF